MNGFESSSFSLKAFLSYSKQHSDKFIVLSSLSTFSNICKNSFNIINLV